MLSSEIVFVRETFRLSQRGLAKALNVSPATAARWEVGDGGSEPTGLHAEVLRALHNLALLVKNDETHRQRIAGLVALGIGSLIFHLLTRLEWNSSAKPRPGLAADRQTEPVEPADDYTTSDSGR